jgi:predicted NUDIX family phosphoesterase
MPVQQEQVMVVETKLFNDCGHFQGFRNDREQYLQVLLENTQYLPRDEMEQDPSFKQLIPYCIFQYIDGDGMPHIFQYTRGKGGGEKRLKAKKSIGIGGHISSLDAGEDSPYDEGMARELEEEVSIETDYTQELVGLINDDETEVGKVHLGVVHLFTVDKPLVRSLETQIADAGFKPLAEILEDIDSYEPWSQFCLETKAYLSMTVGQRRSAQMKDDHA